MVHGKLCMALCATQCCIAKCDRTLGSRHTRSFVSAFYGGFISFGKTFVETKQTAADKRCFVATILD